MDTTKSHQNQGEDTLEQKSELLFLYESLYSVPNGDPFTGEQRYDEETRRALVSDVRIKRFIRDWFQMNGEKIFVSDKGAAEGKGVTAADRVKELVKEQPNEKDVLNLLKGCVDFRLFGGISTAKADEAPFNVKGANFKNVTVNVTGPVQFALLNPSLNPVELRMHQNTSVFSSKTENERGTIGTTSVVPYSLNQIHGWINPCAAAHTGLQTADVTAMLRALWESINNANTRSKSNQNSILLLQFVYSQPHKKIYGLDRLIKINRKPEMNEAAYRSCADYTFDFTDLKEKAAPPDVIEKVLFHTEIADIKKALQELNTEEKILFEDMSLYTEEKKS